MKINVNYKGQGNLSLHLDLYKSSILNIRNIISSIFVFVVIVSAFVFYAKSPAIFKTVGVLVLIAVVAFLPYLSMGIKIGHDYNYHFMRIEGIVDGIRHHQFPVYIQSGWIGDYGFPGSLYYCDIFLYIPAFFRLIGYSFNTSYKLFVFIINLLTAFISFISFKKIFYKKKIAYILTLAYVCAPYRFVDIYVRSAVGEFCAMSFLPLICAGFYGIVTVDMRKELFRVEIRKASFFLVCGMTGIILNHMLTTEMTIIFLLITCLLLCRKIFHQIQIKAFLIVIVKCFLLSMIFIVPFLDFYFNNEIAINHYIENDIPRIQMSGAQIGDLFSFFKDIYGDGNFNSNLNNRMYLSIGLTLMGAMFIAVIYLYKHNSTSKLKIFVILSVLSLFMSTNLFPYDSLALCSKLGVILSQIQFPWRYLSFATVFAVLVLGELISLFRKKLISSCLEDNIKKREFVFRCFAISVSFFILMEVFIFMSNYVIASKREARINTNEIEIGRIDPTMATRYGTDRSKFTYGLNSEHLEIRDWNKNGLRWEVDCKTDKIDGILIVPMQNYKGYKALDDYGNEYEIFDSDNNDISIRIPANFNGRIAVFFQPMWYWYISALISFLCWIFVLWDGKRLYINANKYCK